MAPIIGPSAMLPSGDHPTVKDFIAFEHAGASLGGLSSATRSRMPILDRET
jgi:hypothetical protein